MDYKTYTWTLKIYLYKMETQLDLFQEEETFDFEGMKEKLIENLDMLKEMTVEEQTLYKKWQEMNKGGKMSKIKRKLLIIEKNYGNQPIF